MTSDEDITNPVEARSLKGRAVRGAVATMVSQGLRFLIRLTSQIAIARLLLPADYGLIAMVTPLMALLQLVAELGLGQAVIQKERVSQREVSALFWFTLTVNLSLAALLALAAPLVALVYGEPRLTHVVLAFAALLPITAGLAVPHAMMMRNLRFYAMAAIDVGSPLAGLVAGYWAALSGLAYWSLVIAIAAETAGSALLVWTFARWRPSRPAYAREVWSFARVGGHVAGSNFANYVTTSADAVLLGLVGGKVQLGLYDRAYRLVTQPLGQLIGPFSRVAVPLLIRVSADAPRYRTAYRAMLEVMLLAGVPAILFLMVGARPLLELLLGPNWTDVAPVVSWICVGALAAPVQSSTGWLFLSQGRTDEQLRFAWITAAISVAAFVCGLPWGAVGVAASAGLAFALVATPLVCLAAARTGPIRPRDLVASLAPIAISGSLTGGALVWLAQLAPSPGWLQLLVGLMASYAVFLTSMIVLPAGRRMLSDAWRLRRELRAG